MKNKMIIIVIMSMLTACSRNNKTEINQEPVSINGIYEENYTYETTIEQNSYTYFLFMIINTQLYCSALDSVFERFQ